MESKYKVGDKVRIKSLDWYNSNKDENGEVSLHSGIFFAKEMSEYCGKEFEIRSIFVDGGMLLEGPGWFWSDWMFEDKPTFNKKT